MESKGCDSLTETSKKRGTALNATVGGLVDQDCRRQCTNLNVIKRVLKESSAITQENSSKRCRSVDPQFSFSRNCYFCGQEAKLNGKKKGCNVFPVRTLIIKEKIKGICLQRGDSWAEMVKGRLEFYNNLHAANAIYHRQYNINFRTNKDILKNFQPVESVPAKKKTRKTNRR